MLCTQVVLAVATVVLAGATVWTLRVLIGYASDTKKIAKNSFEQIESSLKPLVALVERKPGHDSNWSIKNVGKGPALNIRYTRYVGDDKPPQWCSPLPLALLARYNVRNEDVAFAERDGFIVEYESLSGRKYRTVVRKVDGIKRHFFEEIA